MKSSVKPAVRWLAMGAAVLGMGVTMPSCPGQQAIQQQIDALQNGQAETNKRVQAMEAQVKSMTQELAQNKMLADQLTNTIQAQRGAIEQLTNAVQQLQARLTAPPKPAAPAKSAPKAAPKKKGH